MSGDGTQADVNEISLGGCLLCAGGNFGVGRVLPLTIDLGDTEVSAIARVLYEREECEAGTCSGMEFVFISPQGLGRLDSFISEQLPSW